jgi:glycosyltransferase involved in cell wall biosynthesis
MTEPLLICAKSEWEPPVRREHAWGMLAAERGHPVTFVERPADIRAAPEIGLARYLRRLRAAAASAVGPERPRVVKRATLVPGHRSAAAAALDRVLLRRVLERYASDDVCIVFNSPWDWPAVRLAPAARRIFDMADDWGELMPGRRERFARHYAEIAAEADAIIIVNPELQHCFADREALLVRNGVFDHHIVETAARTEPETMIYVGTLTDRFDAALMLEVLRLLPSWRLELVGACLYAGRGSRPAPELERLLDVPGRVRWHGPLAREGALGLVDRAAVAIIPNRPEHSLGQDSMKLYDYAARGRPIVSTGVLAEAGRPPHTLVADGAHEFAQAVVAAAAQSPAEAAARRAWAAEHTWERRWPAWSEAVFGRGSSPS